MIPNVRRRFAASCQGRPNGKVQMKIGQALIDGQRARVLLLLPVRNPHTGLEVFPRLGTCTQLLP